MKRSYIDLVVEAIIHDFKKRKIKPRQKALFGVMRDGLLLIAKRECVNPHHYSAHSFAISAAAVVFGVAKGDQALSPEARADARQVLFALKGISSSRKIAS
jgi:hypothetical protein